MTVAIFPGSFDPITNGHLDLIRRAHKIFDKVVVAILVNSSKTPLFTIQERLALTQDCLAGMAIEVVSFEGLLVNFAEKHHGSVIIRGLRAVSDFEYEMRMAMMNRELDQDLETVFLMPKSEYSFISSRVVREVAALGGNVSNLVPPKVEQALRTRFGEKK